MKQFILFFILLGLCNSGFAKPIIDVDKFQKRIDRCMNSNSPEPCLTAHLSNHVPPGNEAMKQQFPKVVSLFVQWLGDDSIYAIHPVKTQKVGELVDIRHFAIEAQAGGFMVMKIKYIKLLGKQYLFGFNLSSTDDVINSLLSGTL